MSFSRRPEDWYIFPDSDASQISGIVTSSIFKGVHYEMVVEANGYEFIVQDYHHFAVGEQVGLLIKPFDIHIMKKERVCNTFEGELTDGRMWNFWDVRLSVCQWLTLSRELK